MIPLEHQYYVLWSPRFFKCHLTKSESAKQKRRSEMGWASSRSMNLFMGSVMTFKLP